MTHIVGHQDNIFWCRRGLAGAVEIDDVDPLGSRTGPSARHLHGIAAVDGLALEIPLEEPYAPAAADVNGWNDDQGMRLRNREPGSDSYKIQSPPGRAAYRYPGKVFSISSTPSSASSPAVTHFSPLPKKVEACRMFSESDCCVFS